MGTSCWSQITRGRARATARPANRRSAGRPERSGREARRPFRLHPDAGSGAFKRLGVRGGVHPHDFPDVAVRIFDAAAEHEAVILHRIGVGTTAGGRRPRERRIHRIAAVDAEGQQRVTFAPRVADQALRLRQS
jgi:hypothetical protein